MEGLTAIVIDETYEFSAPRFYDFINGESEEDIQNAERWFVNNDSHAPSPCMMRIKPDRSVELSNPCDLSKSEQTPKEDATNATFKVSDEPVMPAESRETSNPSNEPIGVVECNTVVFNESTAASQGISTVSRTASSQLKKQQSARTIAAALKNPSALESKMLSHSSHKKSAKPALVRDTGNLKSSTGTPNLVLENQAIKRQKLDCGKSRQILNIKTPNLPHKTRPAAPAKVSKLCSSMTNETANNGRKIYVREEPVPFVSMAEMMKKFQSSTRDKSLPQHSLQQDAKLGLTRPKEPEFVTSQRARTSNVKSSAELEEEMMAKMAKFKARPLNKKILEASSLPPLPKSVPQPTEFQEFHLETMERGNKNAEASSVVSTETRQKPKFKAHYLTAPTLHTSLRARPTKVKSSLEIEQEELDKIPKFKARPLNKKIFESKGEIGLFCNNKKQVTVPQEFHFATDERIPPSTTSVSDLFDKLSLNSEQNHEKHIPRNTRPSPFHLHTEERGAEKERKLVTEIMLKQWEEERARVPKANPYPYTTDYPLIPPKPQPKECTKPNPFHLESLERHEEEMRREMDERRKKEKECGRMRRFKAQPVLKEDPIRLPEKERKPLTQILEFNLHVEHRAMDRADFDKKIKEKEMIYKRYREEAEAEKQVEEEKALKHLRRTMVPHARPVPSFANPFVAQKSCKETTKAKSPKLRVLRRRKEARNEGFSGTDVITASSAAAALMR